MMTQVNGKIDHFVYAANSLDKGIEEISELLGVTPLLGGKHPHWGTHNALVRIGPTVYLEIVAPDPSATPPDQGVLFDLGENRNSRLITWAWSTEQITSLHETLSRNSLDIGEIQSGSRRTTDDTLLHWKLTDPYAMPFQGAFPFLIDWGETTHPTQSMPLAVSMESFQIEYPDPDPLKKYFQMAGIPIKIIKKKSFRIRLMIRTLSNQIKILT